MRRNCQHTRSKLVTRFSQRRDTPPNHASACRPFGSEHRDAETSPLMSRGDAPMKPPARDRLALLGWPRTGRYGGINQCPSPRFRLASTGPWSGSFVPRPTSSSGPTPARADRAARRAVSPDTPGCSVGITIPVWHGRWSKRYYWQVPGHAVRDSGDIGTATREALTMAETQWPGLTDIVFRLSTGI